jgi:plastocyanin
LEAETETMMRDVYISLNLLIKQMASNQVLFGVIILVCMFALVMLTTTSSTLNATPTIAAAPKTIKVAAGGGNASAPWTLFVPQKVTINAGDSVMWYNPTVGAAEPHTVTFALDNSTLAGVASQLAVSNMTKFDAIPAGSNNEPLLIPGESGTNTLIGINARTYNPVTIDSQDRVQFMNPNANYSVAGDEKYVNSRWFLPEGLEKQYPGTGNTFVATFEEPGTYDYLCILHPWMTGTIEVVQ